MTQPKIGSHAAGPIDEPIHVRPANQPDELDEILEELLLEATDGHTKYKDFQMSPESEEAAGRIEKRLLAWRDKAILATEFRAYQNAAKIAHESKATFFVPKDNPDIEIPPEEVLYELQAEIVTRLETEAIKAKDQLAKVRKKIDG